MPRPSDEVRCKVFKQSGDSNTVAFRLGIELTWFAHGGLGPHGLTAQAADLIDLALSVFVIEKEVASRSTTNPVVRVELNVPLRDVRTWKSGGETAAARLLDTMGIPSWFIEVRSAPKRSIPPIELGVSRAAKQVALFSGGLDSTSGAATLNDDERAVTVLASFYTRQLTLQRSLAEKLGLEPPAQFGLRWERAPGRGRSFRYRSFLFLSIAAAVASSWRAQRILQFENGILASSIGPAPSFMMTRHAHPSTHRHAEALFSSVLNTPMTIANPFFLKTKRQCVESVPRRLRDVLRETETCWFLYSNHIAGRPKSPHEPCGVCIPCLLRRTAFPDEPCKVDLRKDSDRNDEKLGRAFRSYYSFLDAVRKCRNSIQFYEVLSASGRELVTREGVDLDDLHGLFRTFAKEFFNTFR